jgi:hypothetical protein
MSNTENPIHAPLANPPMRVNVPKRPPNQKGDEPRVRIHPLVDRNTIATIAHWQDAGKASQGEIIDRLTSHALATGYDPATCQPEPTK